MSTNTKSYGSQLTALQIVKFIDHVFSMNEFEIDIVKPICIWGKAGIGKTQLVKNYAQDRGYDFAYCAPAQFEEMGDFHGIPVVNNGKTLYNPPEWVPVASEKPGILLIDDFNRADDRILRGLMQLFQNNGMMSWQLPKNWRIICTANPEGEEYSITTLDDAMLTRMMHVSFKFDPKEWARWAVKNKIDERGIDFVLTYPEIINGTLTNPRTISTFFYHLRTFNDLKKSLDVIYPLSTSLLDKETASAFIAYINEGLDKIITPEEIINSKDFKSTAVKIKNTCIIENSIRIDILTTITTRILIYLQGNINNIENLDNLANILLLDFLPNDLRTTFHLELISLNNNKITKTISKPDIAKLIVGDNI
jgi:hypothetical protein